jgi:hypothetical protein
MRCAGLSLAIVMALSATADLIDRVAVAVENSVITESEILRQIRLTAFLNKEKPDFSAAAKRATAERLVEQSLVRREIGLSRYLPDRSDAPPDLYKQFRERFGSEAAWNQALRDYNVTDPEVRDAFRWQVTLLDFIDQRFRPGIQVPEEDVRDYYDTQVANKTAPEVVPSFEEARDRIERILVEERVNSALDRWLGQARTQLRIRYKEEVFQ